VFQAVVAKQYDMNTRFIKATFVDNGDKIYIDPEATVKVVINALRPDGESKAFDGEVNQDGTVTVPLHSWMLELVGTVTCDISAIDTETDDNKKLTTTSFTLLVEKAAYGGDDVTNDPQYDVLVQLLETCSEAGAVAEDALQKSNEAIERAKSVKGIYIGSGDMPEGYSVQIDDSGAVFEMDTELNAESMNPVTNAAVTKAMATATEEIGKRFAEHQTAIEEMGTKFAPMGFGLGTDCVWIDWNNGTENGFYRGTANSPDGYAWYGYAIKSTGDYIVQHAFTVNTAHGFATHCVRVKNVDKWEPWEYVNPPMISGVEYRTTERFLGKPVYTKLWSVETGSTIQAGIGENVVSEVVELRGMCKTFQGIHMDFNGANVANDLGVLNYSPSLDRITFPDFNDSIAYIIMKYTKS
jgi:hypothetical protein